MRVVLLVIVMAGLVLMPASAWADMPAADLLNGANVRIDGAAEATAGPSRSTRRATSTTTNATT